MAIRLKIQEDRPKLTVGQESAIPLRASSGYPIYENNYDDLRNKPSINGVTLVGDKTTEDLGIEAGVTSWNGQTGDVVYTPPEVPVQSVNGKTGAVVLDASDVGALPDSTEIPTKTSELTNDSGFITSVQAPVQSVNGQTGAVVLDAEDVGAIPEDATFALEYDEAVSVGSAVVGTAVTGEPNYTPTGTIQTTSTEVLTGGTVALDYTYSNYKLTISGITFTPTKTNVVAGATFQGTGVNFAIEQEN